MGSSVFILIAIVAICSREAYARAPTILGQGTASCGLWTEGSAKPAAAAIAYAWLLGNLSGYNVLALSTDEDVGRGIDNEGLTAWMDAFCLSHPLDIIQAAANALLGELRSPDWSTVAASLSFGERIVIPYPRDDGDLGSTR